MEVEQKLILMVSIEMYGYGEYELRRIGGASLPWGDWSLPLWKNNQQHTQPCAASTQHCVRRAAHAQAPHQSAHCPGLLLLCYIAMNMTQVCGSITSLIYPSKAISK